MAGGSSQAVSTNASTIDAPRPLTASQVVRQGLGLPPAKSAPPAPLVRRGRRVLLAEGVGACAPVFALVASQHRLSAVTVGTLALWASLQYVAAAWGAPVRRPSLLERVHKTTLVLAVLAAASVLPVVQTGHIPTAVLAVLIASGIGACLGWVANRSLVPLERVLVVGAAAEVIDVLHRWSGDPLISVVGACVVDPHGDGGRPAPELRDLPLVHSLDAVPETVNALSVDSVAVVPGPTLLPWDLRKLSWSLEATRTPLSVISVLDKFAPHRVRPSTMGGRLVVRLGHTHRAPLARAIKTAVDRGLGTVLLVLFAPVIGALCLWVRLDSPGGSLFRQQRIGLDGKPFTMYKLRTMRADAEQQKIPLQRLCSNQMLFKLKQDPRITRAGRLLRRSSLDELPQLINVAKGDMSLVGPRPPLPDEVAKYDDESRRRLAVRPGITGLWQVSGRSDLNWEDSLALDLHYVDNWRFSDDVLIAFRTVEAVFRSRGAY